MVYRKSILDAHWHERSRHVYVDRGLSLLTSAPCPAAGPRNFTARLSCKNVPETRGELCVCVYSQSDGQTVIVRGPTVLTGP
jgi:hypothetical protein